MSKSLTLELLKEHISTPGHVYNEEFLLYGDASAILNEMQLTEASDATGVKQLKFRGKFQEANAVNKNKRMYTWNVLNSNVDAMRETMEQGGLIGELDHPTDSIVHFLNASHKITKLWWEGNSLMGEGVILSTPGGKILRALINDGVRIGISSRGVGNGKVNEDGILVIGESYKLITFDAVADPSTHKAFQKRVVGTKEESFVPQPQNAEISVKNENTGIHKISKELILACFSGIVKKQTGEIKARI